jgi:hypothetical protein
MKQVFQTYQPILICLLMLASSATSCTSQGETLRGRLMPKSWSKTIQSYCAGGSGYWVLQKSDSSEVILFIGETGSLATQAEALRGQAVALRGQLQQYTVEPSPNPMEQKPIGMDGKPAAVSCERFEVTAIQPLKN